jgi:hypothetical protein
VIRFGVALGSKAIGRFESDRFEQEFRLSCVARAESKMRTERAMKMLSVRVQRLAEIEESFGRSGET